MTLEKQAERLLESVTNLVNSVNDLVAGGKAAAPAAPAMTAAGPGAGEKKVTKKELAELKKEAKAKAGSVLKDLGKDKLGELLKDLGAKKFSDLKSEPDIFKSFIEKAEAMLDAAAAAGPEDDDLLGDDDPPPAPEKEYTAEDVKALLLKVNNSESLGRDVTRQILGDLGVSRLPQLKKEKFAEAVKVITKTLKDAGVE